MKKNGLILVLLHLFILKAFPQVDLKMNVRNPIPSEISAWTEDPTVIQVIATNNTSSEFSNCYLGFTITNEHGEVVAETNLKSQFIPRVQIPPAPSVVLLNGNQIFNTSSVTFNRKLERLALTTNTIPEGDYEICISLYDQFGSNITIGENYCTYSSALIPEPPVLISPIDDDVLTNPYPMFSWTPVTNYNPGRNQLKYKLKICPVFKGQTPRDAIERNQVLIEKNDIYTTSYHYMPSDMAFDYFQGVTRYVWMVQAFNGDNNPASSNQGKSELGIFLTKEEAIIESEVENIYPANNDTIPWAKPHLIAGLKPYSDQLRAVSFKLMVRDESSSQTYTHSRTLDFNGGPKVSQSLSDDAKATWLIANLDANKAFPGWMQNLVEGKKYFWNIEATYTNADGTSFTKTTDETSFVIGLKQPTFLLPKADTSLRANNPIGLEITLLRPNTLNLLTETELNNSDFHGYNSFSTAQARLQFELAKNQGFDTIMQTKKLSLPTNSQLQTTNNCDDLFKKQTTKFDAVADTGTYFWRVKYLGKNDSAYFISEARKLKIVPDSIYNCFAMEVLQPANDGKWTEDKKPQFSVSVNPEINKKHITGGRIRVWKKTEATQSNENAKLSTAKLDTTFKGSADTILYTYSSDYAGNVRIDLNLINGSSQSKTFECDSAAYYVWNLQLSYNKDSIRKDGMVCGADSVISNDGVFQVLPSDKAKNRCPGDCMAEMPDNTSSGSQTLAKDSTLKIGKFDLNLITVSGGPSGLSGTGSIKVPYVKANIMVEFNNLKVNSDNEVFDGEAYAQLDPNAPYTKEEGNDFQNKAYSFAEDKLKFKQIHEHSSSLGKLVSGFVGSNPVTLPLGYDNDVNGYKYVLGIIGMRFTPTMGEINLAAYIEFPSLGPDMGLGFGAKNICIHKDGIGSLKKAMLYLSHDIGYDNNESWSFEFKAPTPADSGTYVLWDCGGMADLTIAADVAFPRTWMTPVNNTDPAERVKARMKFRARESGSSWHWLASGSLDDCELSGAPGYKLQVQEMAWDHSDSINPSGMVFPALYIGNKTTQWKGFYIKRASLTLPEDLKTFDDRYPTIAVNHMMINDDGFTASIVGDNIIQYPEGDFGGWGASIDSIRVDMVNSSLQAGMIKGRLKMSIADTCLVYTGTFANDTTKVVPGKHERTSKYLFSVVPKDTLKVDMFGHADFNLFKTSTIQMYNDSMNSFIACADLSGSVTIKGDAGGLSKLDFKGIKFENLKVQNKKPYFDIGDWGMASPQHGMAGFPVSIDHINMVTGSRGGSFGAGLQFDLTVGLQEGANAISGTTKLSIWGKLASESGPQHFVFDGVELDSIGINADLGAVIIKGGVNLYDSHATFGDGFRGAVSATFIDQATIEATAQFGSVDNYRYWYVDGKALFNEGVPMFSGLGIYGFGGGAWYHMQKSGTVNLDDESTTVDTGTTPGKTNSGYSYVPNKNIALGLNAKMIMGTHPKPDAFNSDVGLSAQFLSNGGIGTISLLGNGYMLCGINNRDKAKVLADMDMTYDFPSKTFHGVFDVDINANPLDGGGQMTLHFDPDLWYVKVGEPSNRLSIDLDSWLSTDGYFMVGQQLPSPELPSQILQLFPEYTVYRNPAIETGDGFAFGASSSFDTGRKPYLIFYGEISALMGFDMALLNYGESTTCEGQTGSIGVNGWYAMGQIYASVAASIGLYVDLWVANGYYEILNLQAAAMLQGAGPNPTWVKGTVGGRYNILKGAVKGYCNYQFSMGNQCEMVTESALARIDLISDINPVDGQRNVDVHIEPQVAMNFELETPFELNEMPAGSGQARLRTFRIKLDDLKLNKAGGSDSIQGYFNVSPDRFSAYYKPHEILGGNTNYRFAVSAYGEELVNNQWSLAKKNDGSFIKQRVTSNFKTGPAPDRIMPQNVAYSYPVNSHSYLLQDECRNGRIQLISATPDLFNPRPGFDIELVARFVPSDINTVAIEVPFTYNNASKAILIDIPTLINNRRYYMQIVRKEICNDPQMAQMQQLMQTMQQGGIQQSFTLHERKLFEGTGSSASISERKITGQRVNPGEKLLYVLSFKTSNFNSLQAKLSSYNHVSTVSEFGPFHGEVHTATYRGTEYFDNFDFEPVRWTSSGSIHQFGPLVKINAWQRNSAWHNSFANPVVYDQIEWMKERGFWGSTQTQYEKYFINPDYNFVEIDFTRYRATATDLFGLMTGGGTSGGQAQGSGNIGGMASSIAGPGASIGMGMQSIQSTFGQSDPPQISITYNHGKIVPADFQKMKDKAAAVRYNPFISKSGSEKTKLNAIINSTYTYMPRGNYPLLFYYNYFGCLGIDQPAATIDKPFIY
jgi:hypothetical protein